MKPSLTILATLLMASATARAQAVPAVNGSKPLPISGTLRYDLRYSQTAQLYGDSQGNTQSSVLSGELTYANLNAARPFSLTYSGGDMWNITGSRSGTGVFQHMLVSQGLTRRKWALSVSDDVSYLPQAPTTGFSGIAGVGSLPSDSGQSSQTILTLNTRSLYNSLSPNFTRHLDYATSLSVTGSYTIMRFPDSDGLETNQLQVGPQITRRLNALNSIFGQYSYSRFSYPGQTSTMAVQSLPIGYTRAWNRRLNTSVSLGPEWTRSSGSSQIPSSTGLTVNANATYGTRTTTASLGYSQATTGGAGAATEVGVRNHDLNAGLTRQFGRNLTISANGAYMRTQGMQQAGVTNGKYGGASATQRLGRYVTVFANYTAIQQSSSAALPANAISGLSHVIGFGIGYSPRELHFKK
jgi:hypothetical protein